MCFEPFPQVVLCEMKWLSCLLWTVQFVIDEMCNFIVCCQMTQNWGGIYWHSSHRYVGCCSLFFLCSLLSCLYAWLLTHHLLIQLKKILSQWCTWVIANTFCVSTIIRYQSACSNAYILPFCPCCFGTVSYGNGCNKNVQSFYLVCFFLVM